MVETPLLLGSASFLDELSVGSPRKIIYFYYLKIYFLDQSIQKIFYFILEKEALLLGYDLNRGLYSTYTLYIVSNKS